MKVFLITLNLLYTLVSMFMFLSERLLVGIWMLGLYFFAFAGYAVVYWIPHYVKALRTYGKPTPPLKLQLGAMAPELRTKVQALRQKDRVTTQSKKFGIVNTTLFEETIETQDGSWYYQIETEGNAITAFACTFNSHNSKFLNFGFRKGSGYFFSSTHTS